MNDLASRLNAVMDAFPAKTALYCVDLTTGTPIAAIRENTVRMLLTLVPRRREDVERKAVAKVTATSAGGDDTATHTTVRKGKKVGPNDPCPCGSGKKYKKCCGAPGKEKPTQE